MINSETSLQSSETGDPRLNDAQRELGFRLKKYRDRQPQLTRRSVKEMQTVADDFRGTCKQRGIDFPKLKIVAFVSMNHICVWPHELPHEEIQKRLRMFIVHRQRHNLPVDAEDLAKGVRRAYPDYSASRFTLCPETAKTN